MEEGGQEELKKDWKTFSKTLQARASEPIVVDENRQWVVDEVPEWEELRKFLHSLKERQGLKWKELINFLGLPNSRTMYSYVTSSSMTLSKKVGTYGWMVFHRVGLLWLLTKGNIENCPAIPHVARGTVPIEKVTNAEDLAKLIEDLDIFDHADLDSSPASVRSVHTDFDGEREQCDVTIRLMKDDDMRIRAEVEKFAQELVEKKVHFDKKLLKVFVKPPPALESGPLHVGTCVLASGCGTVGSSLQNCSMKFLAPSQ
eukprot:TRINITY_DN568_c0_g2_i2.p1 TRINITY_DN568_c0_g2~~TRINITY_DN568_c0_g2_i2.p1  ORF type:complete len:258 (-),score=73.21 TRINITY_DN568_c0_g2_i2:620-1393(-)